MHKFTTAKTAIEHFEGWANMYDGKSSFCNWRSPDILFGLHFEYVKPGERILDLGCGTGLSSLHFSKIGMEIWGLDGSPSMIREFCRKKIAKELITFDLSALDLKLPYRDNFFDHITSNGVLYFFENPEPILKECSRIIKTDGTISFTIEELPKDEVSAYVNNDNAVVQEEIRERTGVNVYRHKFKIVKEILKNHDFKIFKKLNFHAYKSPTTGKEVYFVGIVAKKV